MNTDEIYEQVRRLATETVDTIIERGSSYGTPTDNHKRTATFWSAYLGMEIDEHQVCMLNILQKIARDMQVRKDDNETDIIGYALNVRYLKLDGATPTLPEPREVLVDPLRRGRYQPND